MKRLGVTMGDPAGVGPEVLLRAASAGVPDAELAVFGDRQLLRDLSRDLGLDARFDIVQAGSAGAACPAGSWSEAGARASVEYLRAAAASLQAGEIDALVTGPIHKRSLAFCSERGPGQTEWLAQRFGVELPVMAFWSPSFWLVLATGHLPLRQVAGVLSRDRLLAVIRLAHRELCRFLAPARPRLALAALNPHGEEDGLPAREEQQLLGPVVEQLAGEGISIAGPLAADSIFHLARRGDFDAVVALYHDQGLGPLKALHFTEAVHLTLGLPFVRTSPDHGVAYPLAGKRSADPTSMREALCLAARLAHSGS